MRYYKNPLSLALFALLALIFTPNVAQAQSFAIVVNSANGASAGGIESELKNLFLKKQTKWSSGADAVPLARASDSPEHQAFLSSILGMSQSDLDSYWSAEKSKTGSTGPREVGSTNILLRQVSRKEGAFGIVSAADTGALPDGVKVLTKF